MNIPKGNQKEKEIFKKTNQIATWNLLGVSDMVSKVKGGQMKDEESPTEAEYISRIENRRAQSDSKKRK